MARDSIRPFILGLLFVYLLEPPVRWLVRRGVRRIYAIVLVYVIGIVLFVEFLALTLTPLVNEVVRFVQDFPKLAAQLDEQLKNLGEFYQRLQIPVALRDWIDGIVAGSARAAAAAAAAPACRSSCRSSPAPGACSARCSPTSSCPSGSPTSSRTG